ncbi:hypothetical protein LMH87_003155 [Akanthomyces muscarius]|uniref:Uncharacterized protein n=1 Tax=Akanthomyces muscarius TaxID=2231603 RepID=A0A9W8Q212_AKAMU|nr:hypothetical protein LMH87_003155 [Akanthomyces muscarius]KAJ4144265.1 hypothetical protein LMH87_003155 [Akanthomyces muscarius]
MSGFSAKLLQGKVGIVTGAGSPYGIGRSLVLGLAAAGARAVYATDLMTKHIASLRDEVKKSGSSCEVREHVLDVTDEAQTIEVLKKIIADYGRLDFYFANAGVGLYKPLPETDTSYYDKMINIMQRSFFLAIRYGGQAMSNICAEKPAPGGSIIVTSSMAGASGGVSDISYSSAKAAVSGMAKPGAVQLSSTNVRVNAIAPGFVRSSIVSSSAGFDTSRDDKPYEKKDAASAFDRTMGRFASEKHYYSRILEPEEIANIGVFLASDLAASINGENIMADSGRIAAGSNYNEPMPRMTPLQP